MEESTFIWPGKRARILRRPSSPESRRTAMRKQIRSPQLLRLVF